MNSVPVYACPKTYREKKARKRIARKRPVPRRSKRPSKANVLDASALLSKLTLAATKGWCEVHKYSGYCRATEAAHGLPKGRYRNVRFHHWNLFALCREAHQAWHKDKALRDRQRMAILGPEQFHALNNVALGEFRPNVPAVIEAARHGEFLYGAREVL